MRNARIGADQDPPRHATMHVCVAAVVVVVVVVVTALVIVVVVGRRWWWSFYKFIKC